MVGHPDSLLEAARSLEDQTVETLMDLVRIPSFSGQEKDVVACIAETMRQIGLDEVRVDPLGNVIGRLGRGPRVLALDAHIDTVMPGNESLWDFPPFEPFVANGQVWGRGTVDQKGGMASMLTAARILKAHALPEDTTLYLTGTVMEEDSDGLCWLYLIREEKIRPDLVVLTEPTRLNLYRGHRGRMEIEVEVMGLSCHGSAPERGENAIYKISRIALEIEKLHDRLASDAFLGKGSICATEVYFTGPSQCAVPDGARLHLDRRLTQNEDRERALEEVRDAARRAGCPEALVRVPEYLKPSHQGLVYPMEKYYPTWVLPEDSPWLSLACETYQKVLGHAPKVDKWTFSTNGVAIAGLEGIPCLGLGPGDERLAHAPNEHCPVDDLNRAAAFYAGLALGVSSSSLR